MKTCSRCEKTKPNTSFDRSTMNRDGFSSNCKTCHRQIAATSAEVFKPVKYYSDTDAYTKRVCIHVATYVERAIQRFETKTLREAPPHLTAILGLANQIAAQQNPHPKNRIMVTPRPCRECGQEFSGRQVSSLYCSDRCAAQSQRRRAQERKRNEDRRCAVCRTPLPIEWNRHFYYCGMGCRRAGENLRRNERRSTHVGSPLQKSLERSTPS